MSEVQNVRIDDARFHNMVKKEAESLAYGFICSDPSKTAERMSKKSQLEAQFIADGSAKNNVEKAGYLLKGTKSGHISKADSETQKTFSKHRVELEKIWFICESETCLYVSKAMTKEATLGDLENLLKAGEIESKIFTQLKSALVKREKEKAEAKAKKEAEAEAEKLEKVTA